MTREHAKELLPIITAFANGDEIEMRFGFDTGWELVHGPCFDSSPSRYRIKPAVFPDPPEGREWHNPAGLTPAQVGTKDGWRLLLVGEEDGGAGRYEHWCNGRWFRGAGYSLPARLDRHALRTQRPLPEVPNMVPLGPEDVPPGSCIRMKLARNPTSWAAVTHAAPGGIRTDYGYLNWDELLLGYEIQRPGEEWKPCCKPA